MDQSDRLGSKSVCDKNSGLSLWISICTGVLGLVSGIVTLVVKVNVGHYEIRKARAEAERAETAAEREKQSRNLARVWQPYPQSPTIVSPRNPIIRKEPPQRPDSTEAERLEAWKAQQLREHVERETAERTAKLAVERAEKERQAWEKAQRIREQIQRERVELEAQKRSEEMAKRELKAGAHLRYAKKLIGQGMKPKAIERLYEVMNDFPHTPAAEEAEQLLAEEAQRIVAERDRK
jgi:hypothetical protein